MLWSHAGLSAEQLPDGRWRLWIHIADPSRWLDNPGRALVGEAERRSKSVYLPTGEPPHPPSLPCQQRWQRNNSATEMYTLEASPA